MQLFERQVSAWPSAKRKAEGFIEYVKRQSWDSKSEAEREDYKIRWLGFVDGE